ncbi:c6 zinc finger domain containing protein [Grosmannia clavigera kw1407]|uniref:C6 zinc finger domain containing protein n=1 Tax=Grosmannia clavigera (strain kw1407 / UAMH 11150) TaxID=655863 RepID=F0XA17_GROCL|nr:c6 zinc finger domain containing protein [Grosmannia clavigera kw1407]EFX05966.1 c6 zinc finger domain containing protein [Grosmannia clavigera kw1407]
MDSQDQPSEQRKRTRQACEPCRRKKAKCTGERPGCSTCGRLRQRCFYAADPRPMADMSVTSEVSRSEAETLSTRVLALESTLTEVLESLRQGTHGGQTQVQPSSQPPSDRSSQPRETTGLTGSSRLAAAGGDLLPPWPTVLAAARDYLQYCDSQPIPLFDPESFVETLADRDEEVVYGVLALAGHFASSPSTDKEQQERDCSAYAQAAHRLVMGRVSESRVELSTIQTLCLLSLIRFYDGAIDQSRVHSSLAMTLAHCAGLHIEVNRQDSHAAAEERRRCYWGVVLLRRLFGWAIEGAEDDGSGNRTIRGGQLPLFPTSPSSPLSERTNGAGCRRWTEAERLDGILSTVIQLAEVWSLAQDYVRTRGASGETTTSSTAPPPWSPQSKYSRALRRLMDLGQDLPPLHRNRCVRLADVTADDLADRRGRAYWAPWFLSHFLYHTAICLLNHPLLMTLQFQDGRGFSEVFLQQTAHLAAYHSSWLLHFVHFFDTRRFAVSDPLFGYCTAVVATIELQHSFSDDRALRHKARVNYDHCLAFLRRLSRDWPCVRRLTQKLDALADQMVRHDTNDSTLTVNISGFLDMLDLASSSRVHGSSIFGASLSLHVTHEEAATSDPTPLSRLPAITTMDPAKATGRDEQAGGGVAAVSAADTRSLVQASPLPLDGGSGSGGDMFLPADQLLGGHLQDVNAWWSGTWGDAAGSWAPTGFGRSAWPLDGNEPYPP